MRSCFLVAPDPWANPGLPVYYVGDIYSASQLGGLGGSDGIESPLREISTRQF